MIRQIMRENLKKVIPHFYFLDIQVFTFIGESVIIKRIDITLDHNRGDNMKINEELSPYVLQKSQSQYHVQILEFHLYLALLIFQDRLR